MQKKDKTQIEILDFFLKKSCKAVESNCFLYLSGELLFFFFKVNTSFFGSNFVPESKKLLVMRKQRFSQT